MRERRVGQDNTLVTIRFDVRRTWVFALAAVAWLGGCGRSSETPSGAPPDTLARPAIVAPPPDTAVHGARYRAVRVADRRGLKTLWSDLGPERFRLVLAINRRDSLHVRDGDSLMVPLDSTLGLMDVAPFPRRLPSARERGKLLLVSRRVQAWAAYDGGQLVRWGPTSTGRESLQTPEGLYHTNWKDRDRTSTFNDEWRLQWYVNLENYLGISFHLFDLPGYPASHSCVRLLENDARWIYAWSESWTLDPRRPSVIVKEGTPVLVFGAFAYRKRYPWRALAADSSATDVPLFEIEAALGRAAPVAVSDSLKRVTLAALTAPRDSARGDSAARPAPHGR